MAGRYGRFLRRRIAQALVVMLLIVVVNFTILHMAPGDAVDVLAGESGVASEQFLAELRQRFGLDQPIWVQFLKYLWQMAQLDLGYSHRNNQTVLSLIIDRLPATLLLMVSSIALAFLGGIAFGVAAARRLNSITDMVISVLALLAYAMPLFWLGLMLVILFTLKLGLLPSSGMYTVGLSATPFGHVLDVARHLVLPVLTLSLYYMASYVLLLRASMLDALRMDFVRTARAKGLSPRRITYRHALRNAILPIVTLLGVQVGSMLGGAVVVEVVFGWPGLGRLAFNAIFQRDHNLLLGLLFLCSAMVVVANLIVDLIYVRLDPRIELEART